MMPDAASDAPLERAADRLLLRGARRGGGPVALLAIASLAGAGAQALLPAVIGWTVNAVLGQAGPPGAGAAARTAPTTAWLAVCAVLVVIIVGSGACVQLVTGISTARTTAWLRSVVTGHLLTGGPPVGGGFQAGDVVSRIGAGATAAGSAPANAVLAVTGAVLPVASVVALGLIDPWLLLVFLLGLAVLVRTVRSFTRGTSEVTVQYQREQGTIAARLLDALAGARTIAAAGTRDQEAARVLEPLGRLSRHGRHFWRLQARIAAQGSLVIPLLQVAVLAVAGLELARHRISPGGLLAASQYAVLGAGIGVTLGQLGQLARARAGGRRVAELLAVRPPGYGPERLPAGRGCLSLRGVTALAGGEPVLRGLDFTIPGGACVAVVGASGAGKSVLAGLAGRLADPDEGEVTLDGVPLHRLTRDELRRAVVYAFERPALFGQTVGEAIGFGLSRPPPRRLAQAAEAACANEFIGRLPDGMRTPLAQAPMSGGELQRLGLARTFAHAADARLVILDDATSSLDTVTEMQVGRALTGELSGRTRLIIAHRASTAARADLVAWLDGGGLRALGPHQRLWADPRYRAVFQQDRDGAA
jgi:ATP-binding cassette subfamily B protein